MRICGGVAHLSSTGWARTGRATGYRGVGELWRSRDPGIGQQVAYIQALMRKAGYDDFRSARTEYRLTQRQARGKFTKSERRH